MTATEREIEINKAVDLVWRNLPMGPTTFGPCSTKGCLGSGRGSGQCIKCAEKRLAELTRGDVARRYVEAVKAERRLKAELLEAKPHRKDQQPPDCEQCRTNEKMVWHKGTGWVCHGTHRR